MTKIIIYELPENLQYKNRLLQIAKLIEKSFPSIVEEEICNSQEIENKIMNNLLSKNNLPIESFLEKEKLREKSSILKPLLFEKLEEIELLRESESKPEPESEPEPEQLLNNNKIVFSEEEIVKNLLSKIKNPIEDLNKISLLREQKQESEKENQPITIENLLSKINNPFQNFLEKEKIEEQSRVNNILQLFDKLMYKVIHNVNLEELLNISSCNKLLKKISNKIRENFSKSDLNIIYSRINNNLISSKYNVREISNKIAKFYIKVGNIYATIQNLINNNENLKIPELEYYYYDDNYNYKLNKFNSMKRDTAIQYKNDLTTFYISFTGKGDMPSSIIKFSDINIEDCLNNKYDESITQELFSYYAKFLKNLVLTYYKETEMLNEILKELFMENTINEELTEVKLEKILYNLNFIIENSNNKCDEDYVELIHVYEAILQNRIIITLQNQIECLENAEERLYIQI